MASTALIVDVDRVTGEYISGWPRCAQSIKTILTTRLNVRVMREWWGSDFLDTMDKPMVAQVFAFSIISALKYINEYEPEFDVATVSMTPSYDGSCACVVDGTYIPDQTKQSVSLTFYSRS
jgi:phage baseplate assembly protein W